MGDKDDPCNDRADQLVTLLAIYIAILSRERKGIVESPLKQLCVYTV
jgi:hypothetical protein